MLNKGPEVRGQSIRENTMLKLYDRLQTLRSDEKGAAAAEYALILAIIGSAIAVSALAFGNSIAAVMDRAAARMLAINF